MRSSTRLAEKRQHTRAAESEDRDYDPDTDEETRASHPAKRRKGNCGKSANPKTAKQTRRRGKSLADLPSMPLDILYEIFGYLHPLDLLHVSRATKALRAILLSRSATSVWKRSFSSVEDAPSIPDDISIPHLSSLMFESACQFCLSRTTNVDWECRARVCKKCVDKYYLTEREKFEFMCNSKLIYGSIRSVLPDPITFGDGGSRTKTIRFARSTFDRYVAEYTHLVKTNADATAIEAWRKNKKEYLDMITEHAAECRVWQLTQEQSREDELDQLRLQRREVIAEHLSNEGWADELALQGVTILEDHVEGRKAQRLTERGWLKIKDQMIAFMEHWKHARIQAYRAFTRARYMFMLGFYEDLVRSTTVIWRNPDPSLDLYPGTHDILPPAGDVLRDPGIRNLIQTFDFSLGIDYSLNLMAARAPSVLDQVPNSSVRLWRRRVEEDLLALMRAARPDIEATKTAHLYRATTHFVVGAHPDVGFVGYPRVLTDARVTDYAKFIPDEDTLDAYKLEQMGLNTIRRQPWSTERVFFSVAMYDRAREIVRMVGDDPDSRTAAELDLKDPWFRLRDTDEVWQWRTVLYSSRMLGQFTLLGEEEARRARDCYEWRPTFDDEDAECTHCTLDPDPPLFFASALLYEHLEQAHGITRVKPSDFALRPQSALQPPGKTVLATQ
ncbi:uncharacterized protein SCHCODRAFT_02608854 [Schizophyllum commune H4-8]|nr:uncharacterized protein SCHCODRAFT_02608854 [Schizophyllum commune H4-8]KAI5900815.1 hypothetical protein SCHCODRAFT_02608854 [Schizophyllum commune H4-8]